MRRRAVGVACVVAIVAACMAWGSRPAAAETPQQRGAYLMKSIVACGNCHTPKDAEGKPVASQELAGGLVLNDVVFRAVVPNITPDKETGIGKWTDAQLIEAIRNGKRPDGSTIGPPMPIEFYARMSDSDVRAIVAYLRSEKPIRKVVEKSSYKIPLPPAYGPVVTAVPDVPRTSKVAYGKYLADIGHCMECHTPRPKGMLDLSKVGAGGRDLEAFPSGRVVTANLTPANRDGVVRWTDKQVADTIRTGVRPDGRRLVRLMAFDWYQHIAPNDMDALVAYLRTLPPTTP